MKIEDIYNQLINLDGFTFTFSGIKYKTIICDPYDPYILVGGLDTSEIETIVEYKEHSLKRNQYIKMLSRSYLGVEEFSVLINDFKLKNIINII